MAQIIDEDGNISLTMADYLRSIGIPGAGLDYHILSIIGCQSSGKSTLLNKLFNTTFATMDASTGRQQTTKGIHAAFSPDRILMFDIEGSDSKERGDADALFERKTALFGLALSEVVVVNMYQNDIGRYHAGNMPLLTTVFEVNLQLFASSAEAKCRLMFIVRDASLPKDTLEKQIRRDLDIIWREMVIPPQFAGKTFDDFFEFDFFCLPHFKLKPEEFDVACSELRERFTNPEKTVFDGTMSKLIPGDGLIQYITSVWDSINENRELNLPSQRRTLSSFKCDEFMRAAQKKFNSQCVELLALIKQTPQPNYCKKICAISDEAIQMYMEDAVRYMPAVVEEKKVVLEETISQRTSTMYFINCLGFTNMEKDIFRKAIFSIQDINKDSVGTQELARTEADESIRRCNDFVERTLPPKYAEPFDIGPISQGYAIIIENKMKELASNFEATTISEHKADYKSAVIPIFVNSEPTMWEDVRRMMNTTINETKDYIADVFGKNFDGIQPSDSITKEFYKTTHAIALNSVNRVYETMVFRFDDIFKKTGEFSVFGNNVDINEIFEEAKNAGLCVLKMFRFAQLREEGEPIPLNDPLTAQLISSVNSQSIEARFNDHTERSYIDAVRIRESKKMKVNIPPWMFVCYLVFGIPKIKMIIQHPFACILAILSIFGLYFLIKHGTLNPLFKKIGLLRKKVLKLVAPVVKKKLGNKPPPVPPEISTTESSSTAEEASEQTERPSEEIIDGIEPLKKSEKHLRKRRPGSRGKSIQTIGPGSGFNLDQLNRGLVKQSKLSAESGSPPRPRQPNNPMRQATANLD